MKYDLVVWGLAAVAVWWFFFRKDEKKEINLGDVRYNVAPENRSALASTIVDKARRGEIRLR